MQPLRFLGTILVILLLACPTTSYGEDDRGRPNVILCMADDLGWGDLGSRGHSFLQTPHLDAMAANGLVFDRFYAASPVCSPTRGSCLTGRHPDRYGIPTANAGHLRATELTLAEILAQSGYATGHFGKWHLGTLTPEFSGKGSRRRPRANLMTPNMAGFQSWFSTEYAVATWDPYDLAHAHGSGDVRALYWHNGTNLVDRSAPAWQGCDSRIIMDQALEFLDRAGKDDHPFLAVIWFHAPHQPVIGGPEYRANYAELSEDQQHYAAVVTALDEQVGRLRQRLRDLDVADETMLWFCSDNGPEGNPGPKGRSQGTAGPLRGRKRSLYEGGIRVPGLLEWPAVISRARRTKIPAVTSDYFPTVLDVLGQLEQVEDRTLDGLSLLPAIEGSLNQRAKPIAFHFQSQAALVDNRYKLVHNEQAPKRLRSDNGQAPVSEWELFDLVNDPGETTNVIDSHADQSAMMREQLQRWRDSCQASDRKGREALTSGEGSW